MSKAAEPLLPAVVRSFFPSVTDNIDVHGIHRLNSFNKRHAENVSLAVTKPTNSALNVSVDYVRKSFETGNRDQVILLMEYGIDVFSTFCIDGCKNGQERWVIDFYGLKNKAIPHDVLIDQRMAVLKEYRRHKWKIGLVGGSIERFNRRRQFILFLERYVMDVKDATLREKVKRLMSIEIVQTCIASYI